MSRRRPAPIRRGLVAATTATAAIAVLLVAVPLSVVRVQAIAGQADDAVAVRAQALARVLADRRLAGESVDADVVAGRLLDDARADVRVVGERFTAGADLDGPTRTASASVDWVVVHLTVDDQGTVAEQRRALVTVLALALVGLAVAAAVGRSAARRLAAPIEALAGSAARAGHGDLRERAPRSGIAEVDQVAEALDVTLDRLAERLAGEQQLSERVAHQLRNGLTALRLQVDVATMAAADDAAARQSLERIAGQVDRFETTITDLTRVVRRAPAGEPQPVDRVAAERAEHWRPLLRHAGRAVEVDVAPAAGAAVDGGVTGQVLDVLVENATRHGGGTVRVAATSSGDHVVLAVEDDGPGVDDDLVPRIFERGVTGGAGTGLGLALARDLAAAAGGRLQLARSRPPRFELWLPVAREAGGRTPGG